MAVEIEREQSHAEARATRFDLGAAILQIALIVSAITFFTRHRFYFYLAFSIGTVGILVATTAFLVH